MWLVLVPLLFPCFSLYIELGNKVEVLGHFGGNIGIYCGKLFIYSCQLSLRVDYRCVVLILPEGLVKQHTNIFVAMVGQQVDDHVVADFKT